MANKIKETPVLTGKDVARFDKMIEFNKNSKVSIEEFSSGEYAYKAFGFAFCGYKAIDTKE